MNRNWSDRNVTAGFQLASLEKVDIVSFQSYKSEEEKSLSHILSIKFLSLSTFLLLTYGLLNDYKPAYAGIRMHNRSNCNHQTKVMLSLNYIWKSLW